MMITARLFTNQHLYKTSSLMIKVFVIAGMNGIISVDAERIVFARRIMRSLIVFL